MNPTFFSISHFSNIVSTNYSDEDLYSIRDFPHSETIFDFRNTDHINNKWEFEFSGLPDFDTIIFDGFNVKDIEINEFDSSNNQIHSHIQNFTDAPNFFKDDHQRNSQTTKVKIILGVLNDGQTQRTIKTILFLKKTYELSHQFSEIDFVPSKSSQTLIKKIFGGYEKIVYRIFNQINCEYFIEDHSDTSTLKELFLNEEGFVFSFNNFEKTINGYEIVEEGYTQSDYFLVLITTTLQFKMINKVLGIGETVKFKMSER